jgi:hypothetical protein
VRHPVMACSPVRPQDLVGNRLTQGVTEDVKGALQKRQNAKTALSPASPS